MLHNIWTICENIITIYLTTDSSENIHNNPQQSLDPHSTISVSYTHLDVYKRQVRIEDLPIM